MASKNLDPDVQIEEVLTVILNEWFKLFDEPLPEEEIKAIISTLTQYSQDRIVELRIYKVFKLEEPEKTESKILEGKFYPDKNIITVIIQNNKAAKKNTAKEILVFGDWSSLKEDNTYILYSISAPIVRAINILAELFQKQVIDELPESSNGPGEEDY